ncbi:hypothetical protein LH51_01245 [Nitrincola sp. A-D6]|uniref:hypothetical protein n=1 Tax=Nitrincola sp. A-D6 TaxID=1545442 RepID=UPI00051F8C84|nr:hypothetical protein [Nitrincola sp. A-D6]KGK43286.1 hypothetical protein LH51_01245 [Nitrincola sp. A-D6]
MSKVDSSKPDAQFPQAMHPAYAQYADDEISLVDLAKILIARKVWFFVVFALVVIMSGVFALTKRPQLPVPLSDNPTLAFTTLIAIGYKTPTVFIEPMASVHTLIEDAYSIKARIDKPEFENLVLDISYESRGSINQEGSNILRMITLGKLDQHETISAFHRAVAEPLIARHQQLADEIKQQQGQASNQELSQVTSTSLAATANPLPLIKSSTGPGISPKLILALGIVLGLMLG